MCFLNVESELWFDSLSVFSLQDETATVVASKKRVASLTRHPTCIIREEKGEGRSISQFGRWVRQRLKEAPAVSVSDEDSSYKVRVFRKK